MKTVRLLCLLAACILAGCAPQHSGVTFTSSRQTEAIVQDFRHAYLDREPQGDYHILLVADAADEQPPAPIKGPIQPIANATPRRIMHIHVFWRPLRGLKSDNPSATNASIDFYVIGDRGEPGAKDVIHYQGTAFVALALTPTDIEAQIQNGLMVPRGGVGAMSDALGRCKVEGAVFPHRNRQRVRELLDEVRAAGNGGFTDETQARSVLR